jgi:excisionase family DNA binding protein
MNIVEAAAYLNIPQTTLRDYVTQRLVPFTRIGRHIRFTPEHLAAIIAAGEQRPRKTAAGPTGRRARRTSPAADDPGTR